MRLTPGTRIGPYEVTARIGEGGMGEVYRARDGKLGRDVALKVLPETFTRDPDRVARFEREARVLASLNHSHIGHIYGMAEADGVQALVLEMVEGSTLADLLARGPLALDEALRIAAQIAEAIAAAHELGIVHRDLKPANVKITKDGQVKVLDFGLAKAVNDHEASHLSNVPTIADEPTRSGITVGTPAYMSPEQARGEPVDARTDIWAFGCVLYEMLSGKRAFQASSTADTLVRVLEGAPDWEELPAELSPWLRRLLGLCLARRAGERLRDMHDVRLELATGPTEQEPRDFGPRPARGRWWWVGAALVLAGALLGLVIGRLGQTPGPDSPALARLEVVLPSDHAFHPLAQRILALSPDGRQLAYVTFQPEPRIHLRRLDDPEPRALSGTEHGTSPFFSPDGEWLGFWKDQVLYKLSTGGGAPIALCPARTLYGASWSRDDRILFGQAHKGIFQVPASGGDPKLLIAPERDRGEIAIDGPQLLPDGRTVLFSLLSEGQNWDRASIVLQDLETNERRVLVEGGTDPRVVPSGHLLFVRNRSLYALPFDQEGREVRGVPVPVLDHLRQAFLFETGAGQFGVSSTGTLAYLAAEGPVKTTPVWVDRDGREEILPFPERSYVHARLSPDGRHIVADTVEEQDLWVMELARGTITRLTSAQANLHPVWTADSRAVIFDANLGLTLERKGLDGPAVSTVAATDDGRHLTAVSVSPDGRTLAVELSDDWHAYDIGLVELDGDGTARPLVADPNVREMSPVFSPDGRWLAYVSDETGRNEVYVQPYPELGRRWLVSKGGGVEPMWSRDGREIFYRTGAFGPTMMAVGVNAGATLELGEPRQLFSRDYAAEPISAHPTYDVSSDGRFLMVKQSPGEARSPDRRPATILVVLDWFEELAAQVPRH